MGLKAKNAIGFFGVYLLVSALFGLLQTLTLMALGLKAFSKVTSTWEPEACLLVLGGIVAAYLGLVIFNRPNRVWYSALPFSTAMMYLLVDSRVSTSFSAISRIVSTETRTYVVASLIVVSLVIMLSSLQKQSP